MATALFAPSAPGRVRWRSKRFVLDHLCRNFQVVALQEIHGGLEDFEIACPQTGSNFHVCCSRGPSVAAGGVAVLILDMCSVWF